MKDDDSLREGAPCRAAVFAVATLAFIVFGGITLAVLLLPEEIRTGHYIIGGITGVLALVVYPWQILDMKTRRYVLTQNTLKYRCGVLSTFEVELPYRSVQAITVRRGILQRLFGCGDVRVSAHGVAGPVMISQLDMNSVCIKSISDYAEVAQLLREKMTEHGSHNNTSEITS
jgi:uncharacterized membrane protein YdbT with pleckstrin-like domain